MVTNISIYSNHQQSIYVIKSHDKSITGSSRKQNKVEDTETYNNTTTKLNSECINLGRSFRKYACIACSFISKNCLKLQKFRSEEEKTSDQGAK